MNCDDHFSYGFEKKLQSDTLNSECILLEIGLKQNINMRAKRFELVASQLHQLEDENMYQHAAQDFNSNISK